MTNMKQKIDNHNIKIMSNDREKEEFTRTGRGKTSCPLKGKCLQEGVVHTKPPSHKQNL